MTTRLVDLQHAELAGVSETAPSGLCHRLADEPLLAHDALVQLAGRLPRRCIEHRQALGLPDVMPGNPAPHILDDPSEVAAGIESNGCWMVLWNVEQIEPYSILLDRIIDEALAAYGRPGRWARRREGFIFLSAPGSVTPAHIDPEHNLLLQVRGTKEVTVGAFRDRHSAQSEFERIMGGGCRNIGALPEATGHFDLRPGRGVYIPPLAPHWVRNGPAVSVSFSVTFRSAESELHERVHRFNHQARALGMSGMVPPGRSAGRDRAKAAVVSAAGRVGTILGERIRPSLHPSLYWPDGTRR